MEPQLLEVFDGVAEPVAAKRVRGHRQPRARFSPEQIATVEQMWSAGASRGEVASFLQVSVGVLAEHTSYGQLAHLERRQGRGGGRPVGWKPGIEGLNRTHRDPTPQQIRRACLEIRSRWSPEDAAIRCARMDPRPGAEFAASIKTAGIRVYRVSDMTAR